MRQWTAAVSVNSVHTRGQLPVLIQVLVLVLIVLLVLMLGPGLGAYVAPDAVVRRIVLVSVVLVVMMVLTPVLVFCAI